MLPTLPFLWFVLGPVLWFETMRLWGLIPDPQRAGPYMPDALTTAGEWFVMHNGQLYRIGKPIDPSPTQRH